MRLALTTLALIASVEAAPAIAQMDHAAHGGAPVLTEPGQGAFAALSEVVRLLEGDPTTDWTAVDLDPLRDHLVDMDRLVRDAEVSVERAPDGLRARVTGDPATMASAARMVPAHADQLAAEPLWRVSSEVDADAVVLDVRSDDPDQVAKIAALGFFGLMASRDHHRAHHLAIATGDDPHDH